jgi:guanylate kinase
MNIKKGMLIVISAPAGCGKDTVVQGLFSEYKEELNLFYSVSATTRNKREGEEEGKHYFYITHEKFEKLIQSGEFLEHTQYCGNYYGTRKKTIMKALEDGKNIILKIEGEGAVNVRSMFPDSVLIFLLPPSMEELRRRLEARATETECVIEQRIKKAELELTHSSDYDYRVTNDDLKTAIDDVAEIIRKEVKKCRV